MNDVKRRVGGRRVSDVTSERQRKRAERDDDGARRAERRERLLLDEVGCLLRTERIGEGSAQCCKRPERAARSGDLSNVDSLGVRRATWLGVPSGEEGQAGVFRR